MTRDQTRPSLPVRLARHPATVRFLTRINVFVYRLSGGRLMNTVDGAPVCLVTMTGRKSGKRKTVALMYAAKGDELLLVASFGGAPQHPVWYHNLKVQPDVTIQTGAHRRRMRAREVSGEERRELWPVAIAAFPPWADYQRKCTRELPVFVCEPVAGR